MPTHSGLDSSLVSWTSMSLTMLKLCTAEGVRCPGERVGFPENNGPRDQVGSGQGLCLDSGKRMTTSLSNLSLCLIWECPISPWLMSPCSADPKAADVYDFFLQWIGKWASVILPLLLPPLCYGTRILLCHTGHPFLGLPVLNLGSLWGGGSNERAPACQGVSLRGIQLSSQAEARHCVLEEWLPRGGTPRGDPVGYYKGGAFQEKSLRKGLIVVGPWRLRAVWGAGRERRLLLVDEARQGRWAKFGR